MVIGKVNIVFAVLLIIHRFHRAGWWVTHNGDCRR